MSPGHAAAAQSGRPPQAPPAEKPPRRSYTANQWLVILFVIVMLFTGARWADALGSGRDNGTVVRVIDGDTIVVSLGGDEVTVRLLNVDTPETKDPNQPVQCLGPEASAFLTERLPEGTAVDLKYDEERTDRYGRTLAGVFESGSLINAEIAERGLGLPIEIEPNDRFLEDVQMASQRARGHKVGLFASDIPCTPAGLVEELTDQVQTLGSVPPGDPSAALATAVSTEQSAQDLLTGFTSSPVSIPGNAVFATATAGATGRFTSLRTETEMQLKEVTRHRKDLEAAQVAYDTEQERLRQEQELLAQQKAEQERQAQEQLAQQNAEQQRQNQESGAREPSDQKTPDQGSSTSTSRSRATSTDAPQSSAPAQRESDATPAPQREREPEPTAPSAPESGKTDQSGSEAKKPSSGCTPYGPEIPYGADGGYTGKRYGMPGGKTFRKCS